VSCARCFPELTPADFFRRKQYIMRFLDLVDHFVSPSHFLAERYTAWGIPASKIAVIENASSVATTTKPAPRPREPDGRLLVGFFGQVSELKGVDVLLDAAAHLARDRVDNVSIEINGDHGQTEWKDKFLQRLESRPPNVFFAGPYRYQDVDRLMQRLDVIVVPSIWWENSPVVIQEALRNGRPVVCSDIGGMAEKVADHVNGIHFRTGSSEDLARVLRRLAQNASLLSDLQRTARNSRTNDDDPFMKHIELYRELSRRKPLST
jgi:glycosyltransferase involved in cell wall biosynthesis